MLILSHIEEIIEIDYPPGSGDVVGRVEVSRIDGDLGYAAVAGYLGSELVYHKEVNNRPSFRSHEQRVQKVAQKAGKRILYDASLIFGLPSSIDLVT